MKTNNNTSRGSVLIADEMHLSLIPMLEKIGFQPDYQPKISRQEIIEKLGNYVGLIIRSKTFADAELLKNASNLKFIGRAGAGLDLIDIETTESKGIQIFAANEGNRVAVAEHVIGMVLCLMNNILIADKEVRAGIWQREKNRGYELFGKTVGIIGYGNNGSETAKRFKAFGCKVLAYDKYKSGFGDEFVKESTIEEIFAEAEILSLHIPLTSESNKMVDAGFLDKFSKNIIFINAARGEIVVLEDLLSKLYEGKVLGTCLDVLENEKLQKLSDKQKAVFEKLAESNKVIFTPHIAGWTFESYERINQVLIEKISQSF
ncbi:MULTISPECIES: NAD(P)-dependent oxidoreductase [Emticicia]|uniref:NAD(P)-dependent oxidoreductase n=1 Tax=Emticicia TaxID=312278 RepID=UPI000A8CE14E|nr:MULTISPECIES: NAD(P)-dependent oxidoreductase [Emticicia]